MAKKIRLGIKDKKDKIHLFSYEEDIKKAAGKYFKIEIISDNNALVEGCCGVLNYYDTVITLAVDGGSVCFYGNGLDLNSLCDGTLEISGLITSVEYNIDHRKKRKGRR